ncbi:MAG: SPOR domain-containing protein [Bacteroidales bacterium]|nr:SPOR domain-containing protein [Bacteroidales bacterium]
MKRILLIFGLMLAAASLQAQEVERTAPVDSLLLGKNIFTVMGPGVKVVQSDEVRQAMTQYVGKNATKPISGYRIRVFYDNTPQARTRSEAIENALMEQYPEHKVYRSFESPNYKVLIGNFRSKDEALRIFNALKKTYPTAYIIKDNIEYPL